VRVTDHKQIRSPKMTQGRNRKMVAEGMAGCKMWVLAAFLKKYLFCNCWMAMNLGLPPLTEGGF
jgi:hypothetical protein